MKRTGILLSALLTVLLCAGCTEPESTADTAVTEVTTTAQTTASAEPEPEQSSAAETQPLQNVSALPSLNSFHAKTLDGGEVSESAFASADITVINIWSTTCPPCINEMPELAQFAATLPANVQLMTWCLDGNDQADTAADILKSAGFTGTTLTEGDGDLSKLYNELMYTPTTIFLDSAGNMVSEEVIGAGNIQSEYTAKINAALRAMGKEEI